MPGLNESRNPPSSPPRRLAARGVGGLEPQDTFASCLRLWNSRRSSAVESLTMHNEFTAIIEQNDEWFIAYSPEIPGANARGRPSDQARASLSEAISLILEDRREDALR